jgi:hypothetical protein
MFKYEPIASSTEVRKLAEKSTNPMELIEVWKYANAHNMYIYYAVPLAENAYTPISVLKEISEQLFKLKEAKSPKTEDELLIALANNANSVEIVLNRVIKYCLNYNEFEHEKDYCFNIIKAVDNNPRATKKTKNLVDAFVLFSNIH